MLEYEPEKFPQGLMQGSKMAINLRPPSDDHWNIASDLILPWAMDSFRQWREAKETAQGLEGESEGAKVSPMEASAAGESPHVEVRDSDEALPKRIALPKEQVLETMQEILVRIHTLCIQAMHEMGSVCELDQTLAWTLLAESARVQLIIGEDLTESLMTLHTDLEASSTPVRHCEDLGSSPQQSCIAPSEGHPPKIPAGHLTEGEPVLDGTAGGLG